MRHVGLAGVPIDPSFQGWTTQLFSNHLCEAALHSLQTTTQHQALYLTSRTPGRCDLGCVALPVLVFVVIGASMCFRKGAFAQQPGSAPPSAAAAPAAGTGEKFVPPPPPAVLLNKVSPALSAGAAPGQS